MEQRILIENEIDHGFGIVRVRLEMQEISKEVRNLIEERLERFSDEVEEMIKTI